jgi:hypothetical protein
VDPQEVVGGFVVNAYCYAGWRILSDVRLPELPRCSRTTSARGGIAVVQSRSPLAVPGDAVARADGRPPALVAAPDGSTLVVFPDGWVFAVASDGSSVRAPTLNRRRDGETGRHLLLDQVLPRALAAQGALVLHGATVTVGGKAIALVGQTGVGKSTLAAALAARGHVLLADDGAVVEVSGPCATALPLYPSLRLWPDAAGALVADCVPRAPMAHYADKQRVLLPTPSATAATRHPLVALFRLDDPPTPHARAVRVAPLPARDGCMAVVANSFQLDPADPGRTRRLLADAAALTATVPVLSLHYPRDFACLPDVVRAVEQAVEHAAGRAPHP